MYYLVTSDREIATVHSPRYLKYGLSFGEVNRAVKSGGAYKAEVNKRRIRLLVIVRIKI